MDHTLALKSDGTVWAWGSNSYGQLGDNTTVTRYTPVQTQNLSGITAISTGFQHSLALKSDSTVWAWGCNLIGRLGDNTTTDRHTPVQVQNLSGITAISAGHGQSLALKSDGTVWAWGANNAGALGDGTTIARYIPVQILNLSSITYICSGQYNSLALKSDGTVWAWGANSAGELGDNTTSKRLAPVQVVGPDGLGLLNLYDGSTQPTTYTITYNANGGTVSPSSASVTAGSATTLLTPTRSDYTSTGWFTATSGGTKIGNAGASYTPTANITLYAQWTENTPSGGTLTLAELKAKFPQFVDGKPTYWNHEMNIGEISKTDGSGYSPANAFIDQNHWTLISCNHNGSNNVDCNWFTPPESIKLSAQCKGFAEKLGFDYYGTNPHDWAINDWGIKKFEGNEASSYFTNSLKAGDIVRYKATNGSYPHSIFITRVIPGATKNDDILIYADCNSDGHCKIRWNQAISKKDLAPIFASTYRPAPDNSLDQGNSGFIWAAPSALTGETFSPIATELKDEVSGIIVSGPIDALWSNALLTVADVDKSTLPTINAVVVFDITLTKGGQKVQPATPVTVKIPISKAAGATNPKVYYVDSSGNVTDMNARVEGSYLLFETDHFSYYAITGTDNPTKGIFGTNPKWYGAWWHYILFFIGFGFIWMW